MNGQMILQRSQSLFQLWGRRFWGLFTLIDAIGRSSIADSHSRGEWKIINTETAKEYDMRHLAVFLVLLLLIFFSMFV